MAQKKCQRCENLVPEHFNERSIQECLTCASERIRLSKLIAPEDQEVTSIAVCALCSTEIPQDFAMSILCHYCLNEIERTANIPIDIFLKSTSKPYLVRSLGVICGPFSLAELETRLLTKELGLFDYISKPFGRWHYIREEPSLKEIINRVRSSTPVGEDTNSLTPLDKTVPGVSYEEESQPIHEAVVVEPVESTQDLQLPVVQVSQEYVPTLSRPLRIITVASFIFFFAALGVSFFSSELANKVRATREFEHYKSLGIKSFENLSYKESLLNFEKAYQLRDSDAELNIHYAELLAREHQLPQARRLLDKVGASYPPELKEIYLRMKSLVFFQSGDYEQALQNTEEILKLGLASDVEFYEINRLIIFYAQKKYERIIEFASQLSFGGEREAFKLLLWGLSLNYSEKEIPERLDSYLKVLESSFANNLYYRAERSLLYVLSLLKSGKLEQKRYAVDLFFQTYPDESEDYTSNQKRLPLFQNWRIFIDLCKDAETLAGAAADIRALVSICLYKSQEPLIAKDIIEESLQQLTIDLKVQLASAYIFQSLGQVERAAASLMSYEKNFKENAMSEFYWALKIKDCEIQQNWNCVYELSEKVLNQKRNIFWAEVKRIQGLFESRKTVQAKNLLNQNTNLKKESLTLLRYE